MASHILSMILLAPVVGVFIIMLIPPDQKQAIRITALASTFVSLVLAIYVTFAYDRAAGGVQFQESIPWIKNCFTEPAEVVDGAFVLPRQPGAGTTPTPAAWEQFRQPAA